MREFCDFNSIYDRVNILSESVSKEFPGLKAPWKKAAAEARQAGASAPTREAKMTVLRIVVGLIANRIGRELTAEEERSIMKFRNIASQTPLVEFLKSQEIDGQSYAAIISNSTEQDIQDASERSGIADDIQFQIGQRSEQRKEAYKDRAAAREEAKKMADAAEEGGDAELGNSLDEIGDYIVKFAKGVSEVEQEALPFDDLDIELSDVENKEEVVNKLVEIMSDAGYTAELTPAGLNAEAPVGTFGSQDKAEDLVKGLIMKLFPNVKEDQIGVFLNTDAAVEDEEISDSEIIRFAHELGIEEELILSPDGDLINRGEMLGRISDEDDRQSTDFTDHLTDIAMKQEDAEEEPHAKDTDDATHKGGKLYQGGHQFRKRQSSERARLRGKRVYNSKTGEYEMPEEDAEETVTESYTSQYLTEQASKDERNQKPVTESVSFKEKYKPKTSWQLEELRRYGL